MKTLKTIVILSPAHPLRGGIAVSTERLAKELQQHGMEVVIYSFRLQYPSFLFPGKTQYTDDPPPQDLSILPLINSVNPLNWRRLGRKLRRDRPDVVLVRFWMPFFGPSLGTILRQVRRNHHSRTLALVDNLAPHEKRPGDRPLTRYFVGGVDGFVTLSRTVLEEVRAVAPGKPAVFVPHPIYDNYGALVSREAALTYLQLDPSLRYLLFFGFIRDYKGLDILLRAFADARLCDQELRLIVAGEFYGNEEKYRRLIRELDLADRLILRNAYIPSEEVRYYFGAADLVVQPYRSATQSGISQLAYHFERPMLVTAVGGLPETVAHDRDGYVVPVDPVAVADAIHDFFSRQRFAGMQQQVRRRKKLFSWSNLVAGIRQVWEAVEQQKT